MTTPVCYACYQSMVEANYTIPPNLSNQPGWYCTKCGAVQCAHHMQVFPVNHNCPQCASSNVNSAYDRAMGVLG